MLSVIIGGSGSGKSEYAENTALRLFRELGAQKLIYIATMKPYGEEAQKRIERHRKLRWGKGFETMERYDMIDKITLSCRSVVLIECLSNLAANEIFDRGNKNAADDIVQGIKSLCERSLAVVAVTNEIFSGGLDYDEDTLFYIRSLAHINRKIAAFADNVTEVVFSLPVIIKGGEKNDF